MSEASAREREAFEAAITSSPFERNIDRWPNDASRFAWPGNYKDIAVDLAWCMWQERARRSPAPPVEGSMPAGREEGLPPHALPPDSADARDAARYRWLRNFDVDSYLAIGRHEELDASIDAAMSTSPKDPKP